MLRNRYIIFTLSLIFLMVLTACGDSSSEETESGDESTSGEERVFEIGHIASENHVWQDSILHFDEKLQELSDGRLSVEIYPNGTLGNNGDMMQQLNTGSLDMAWIPAAELTNHSTSFNAWFLPFTFNNMDEVYEMSQTEEALALFDTLDNSDVHSLGYNYIGMRYLLMEGEPITNMDDVKGVNLRASTSPVIVDWWERVGASPTSIPLPDLYTSFERGVIDGIDIDTDALISNGLYEIGKNLTLTNHMTYPGGGFVSQKVWDELSEEDQQIIQKAFDEAQEFNYEKVVEDQEERIEYFETEGNGELHELEDEDRWLEVADEFSKGYMEGDELIDAFIKKARDLESN